MQAKRHETVFEITNRVMDRYEVKPYPFAGILTQSKASRRLNYTATAVLVVACLYLFVRVFL